MACFCPYLVWFLLVIEEDGHTKDKGLQIGVLYTYGSMDTHQGDNKGWPSRGFPAKYMGTAGMGEHLIGVLSLM